jgi:hypothetical protein
LADDTDLGARIEAWPAAAIRLVATADGFARVHLVVTGSAHVERFDRDGRWLDSELARWTKGGRQTLAERDLAEVLVTFGVAEADANVITEEMRVQAEPLVGSEAPAWKNLGFWLGSWAVFMAGWVVAVILAIILLVVLVL